jgi:hypothetical protein
VDLSSKQSIKMQETQEQTKTKKYRDNKYPKENSISLPTKK